MKGNAETLVRRRHIIVKNPTNREFKKMRIEIKDSYASYNSLKRR